MSKSSDLVYEKLRAMIITGEVAPGTQLREEEVAEWCGVSRTPVRDAIRQLESEMFIWRSESQRSYVAKWTPPDIEEFFTLRGMLESHAARRAAIRADNAGLEKLEQLNHDVRLAVSGDIPDVDAFLAANIVFHTTIVEMAASERLAALLNRLVLQPIVKRTALHYDRAQLDRSLSEHEEITAALHRKDADWAGSVATAHIRRAFYVYVDQASEPVHIL